MRLCIKEKRSLQILGSYFVFMALFVLILFIVFLANSFSLVVDDNTSTLRFSMAFNFFVSFCFCKIMFCS